VRSALAEEQEEKQLRQGGFPTEVPESVARAGVDLRGEENGTTWKKEENLGNPQCLLHENYLANGNSKAAKWALTSVYPGQTSLELQSETAGLLSEQILPTIEIFSCLTTF